MDDFDDIDFDDNVLEQCVLAESQALQKDKSNGHFVPNSSIQNTSFNAIDKKHPPHRTQSSTSTKKGTAGNFFDEFAAFEDFSSWDSPAIRDENAVKLKQANEVKQLSQSQNVSDQLVKELNELKQKIKNMEEEIMIKQGEVSNLRNEIQRKDSDLQNEKIKSCYAIEDAEKRTREKINGRLQESMVKQKKLQEDLNKAITNLQFKSHEVEELTDRNKKLESQKSNIFESSFINRSHQSPRKSRNFASNFDNSFAVTDKPNTRSIDVQTNSYSESDDIRNIEKEHLNCVETASLLICGQQCKDPDFFYVPNRFASLLSSAKLSKFSGSVRQELIIKTHKGLMEIVQYMKSEANTNSPWSQLELSVQKWYDMELNAHLRMLHVQFSQSDDLQDLISILLTHIDPLKHDTKFINENIKYAALQCVGHILSHDIFISNDLSHEIIRTMNNIIKNGDVENKMDDIFTTLIRCARYSSIKSLFCTDQGDCIIRNLCDRMIVMKTHGTLCKSLLKLLSIILVSPPLWLRGTCVCPKHLLDTLSSHVNYHISLEPVDESNGQLIGAFLSVISAWQTADPSWSQMTEGKVDNSFVFAQLIGKIDQLRDFVPAAAVNSLKDLCGWEDKIL